MQVQVIPNVRYIDIDNLEGLLRELFGEKAWSVTWRRGKVIVEAPRPLTPGLSMIQSLKNRISSSRLGATTSFVPTKDIIPTLDTSTLRKLFQELNTSQANAGKSTRDKDYTYSDLSNVLTTLLILLTLDEEDEIFSLLDFKWTDSYLPLTSATPAQYRPDWLSSPSRRESFEATQWSFLSPQFDKLGQHLVFDTRTVLPYVELSESVVRSGLFSNVSILCAKIHPLYQTIYHPDAVGASRLSSATPDPKIALKRLPLDCYELFDRERSVLSHLRSLNNPRIIPLLVSYEWRNDYYLMLPFASSTLEELWQKTEPSSLGPNAISWTLQQIADLAVTLAQMHNFPPSSTTTDSASGSNPVGVLHADISPENILVMPSTSPDLRLPPSSMSPSPAPLGDLIFSDFGLSTLLYNDATAEESTPYRGTRTFEAPECRLRLHIGRASDVWSFGGVLLEFLVWLVLGREMLERFFQERCTEEVGSNSRIRSDCFYEMGSGGQEGLEGVKVKEVVSYYATMVRNDTKCGNAVKQALDVVIGGMLVVNTQHRLSAQSVAQRLCAILQELVYDGEQYDLV